VAISSRAFAWGHGHQSSVGGKLEQFLAVTAPSGLGSAAA